MNLDQTRILHLGLGWFDDIAGGLERYQHGICKSLRRMDVDVGALVLSRTATIECSDYPVMAYASPEEPRQVRAAKLRAALQHWLDRVDYRGNRHRHKNQDRFIVSHHASVTSPVLDLIHSFQRSGGEFVNQFQGPWADEARAEGAGWFKTSFQRRMERRVYQSADRLITLSQAFQDIVVDRYGVDRQRVTIVPGAIDAVASDPHVSRMEARRQLGWPADRPTLVCIRRLVRRVGVDVLVTAMQSVVERVPGALLMIGGRGPMTNAIGEQIERLGLRENVRLLGFVADADLPLAYTAADASVVPTQSLEGFGLVTLESMAAGTPAIVTPVGSLPEVMSPLDRSLVLDGFDADSISRGLIRHLQNPSAMPTGDQCRDYVRDHYDWTVIAPKVLAVYTGQAGTGI